MLEIGGDYAGLPGTAYRTSTGTVLVLSGKSGTELVPT